MSVRIEPVEPKHEDAIQTLASDPELARGTVLPNPYPADGARTFIAEMKEQRLQGTGFVFAILAGDELVGVCGLVRVGGSPRAAELGYWVGQRFWGRGYASEGARRVLDAGFGELGLEVVRSASAAWNDASRRVLEKLGFRFTGEGPPPAEKWPPSERFLYFELTRDAWAAWT